MSDVGERIRKQRERLKLTQLELANKIGINNSVLSRIEAGKRSVEDEELVLFANFFEVKSDYLLGLTDNPTSTPSTQSPVDSDIYIAWLGGPPKELDEEEAAHLDRELEMFRAFREKKRLEREQRDQ